MLIKNRALIFVKISAYTGGCSGILLWYLQIPDEDCKGEITFLSVCIRVSNIGRGPENIGGIRFLKSGVALKEWFGFYLKKLWGGIV